MAKGSRRYEKKRKKQEKKSEVHKNGVIQRIVGKWKIRDKQMYNISRFFVLKNANFFCHSPENEEFYFKNVLWSGAV